MDLRSKDAMFPGAPTRLKTNPRRKVSYVTISPSIRLRCLDRFALSPAALSYKQCRRNGYKMVHTGQTNFEGG